MDHVCIHKSAKQHAETSFTQVSPPLTGGLTCIYYYISPPKFTWWAQPYPNPDAGHGLKCTPLSRATPCHLVWTIETKPWLSQTIMNRTQVIVLSSWHSYLGN